MLTIKKLKLLTIISMLLVLYSCKTTQVTRFPFDKGLIAHYPFNGNAKDYSINKKHGMVEGAKLSEDRRSKPNSAYYFDGKDDYIKVENFGELINTEEITVSLWAKSLKSKAQFQLMLCPDKNRFAVSINYYHAGMNTVFWDYGWRGEGGNAPGRLYFRPEPVDTLWHHFAFVSSVSEKSMKIYKDGELLIEKTDVRELLSPEGKYLMIGSAKKGFVHKGYLDDIRIYRKALGEKELGQLFKE